MKSLALCPGCARHVKPDETVCPFCQAGLVPPQNTGVCLGPCSGHRFPRLGRAALAAAGAALLCTSCLPSGGVMYGVAVTTDAGRQTVDAGGQTVDAGDQADAGPDSGDTAK
jgi:hypothetical protein